MAFVMIQMNNRWEFLYATNYYRPTVELDCRAFGFRCRENNDMRLIIHCPRTNIDLLYASFEFYFEVWPIPQGKLGQVSFPLQYLYSFQSDDPTFDCAPTGTSDGMSHGTIDLFEGRILTISIPLQTLPTKLSRHIRWHARPSRRDYCALCTENDVPVIRLHGSESPDSEGCTPHEACLPCILALCPSPHDDRLLPCPFCRKTLSVS